ncbi:MAG TPA: metallophosphoesterase [Thermoanaerobaculia bacterium]|nr:metallophosphoesterase [Thermoanaerobaculia bacterium]
MKRGLGCLLAVLVILVICFVTAGPPEPVPTPPGSFSFAALGDAPYYVWEELRFRTVLRDLEQHDLGTVIHVGDIFWRPCTDNHYRRAFERLDRLRHPVVYTPGDNEWTDCWEPGSGAFQPLERLARLRRIFFARPPELPGLERQPVYVENVRWQQQGVVFAALHVTGSRNGLGRTPEDDRAAWERLDASIAWMRQTFAKASSAPAVVLAFHAGLALEQPRGHEWRKPYEPFNIALEEEVARYGRPVLIIHGDDHEYRVDRPVPRLQNLTRLEVPGSPEVGWVRVVVTPRAASPFTFSERVVPRWKYW